MANSKPTKSARAEKAPPMSLAEEAVISVYRTNEYLRYRAFPIFEAKGITAQQYNVLRILRGAGPNGLPTLELGTRMVHNTPGVTRLLDRLEAKGLVARQRSDSDRRLQLCYIAPAGLKLLHELDPLARESADALMFPLSPLEQRTLMRLLAKVWQTL